MNDSLRLLGQYVKHRWSCADKNGHGVHSPFFFDFITRVLPDTGHLPAFDLPENYRSDLLNDQTTFDRVDLGGGSRKSMRVADVRTVASRSLQSAKWCRLLNRLIRYYRPGSVLELGTSFGVTTEYLALADPSQQVFTIEGDPFIAAKAAERFRSDGFSNIESITGDFDDKLALTLSNLKQVGFVWLDGNHRKAPTLQYVDQILPYIQNDSILILDDIYWSKGMQEAWALLKAHPRVHASIDLFRLGILLFRSEFMQPIHIRLAY
ncbi:MAG: O-methyltransferase [Bacteroidota bacterium]